MRGMTHLAVGAAVVAVSGDLSLGTAAGIMLGSILPDIDSPDSLVGRNVPIIPLLLPHRTITHTIWVTLALWLVCKPVAVGCALHIILDMFNPSGVPLLWPIGIRFKVPLLSELIPSGGLVDTILGTAVWFVSALLYWQLIFK